MAILGTVLLGAVAWPMVAAAATPPNASGRAAAPTAGKAPREPAPIVVTLGRSGITIASDDVEALNQFERVLNSLANKAASGGAGMTIFYLTHAKAATVAETLSQILGGGSIAVASSYRGSRGPTAGGSAGPASGSASGTTATPPPVSIGASSRFTPTGTLRIIPDPRLNALFVQGNATDTRLVGQLLKILDQKGSPEEVLVESKARLIPMHKARASAVANVIRQVYQDRLVQAAGGGGDRGGRPSPEQIMAMMRGGREEGRGFGPMGGRSGGESGRYGGGPGGRDSNRAGAEQPKMSIGVDERTNSLIVAAPIQLFDEVKQLAQELDNAVTESEQGLAVLALRKIGPQVAEQALSSLTGANVNVARAPTSRPGSPDAAAYVANRPSPYASPSPREGQSAENMMAAIAAFRAMREMGGSQPPNEGEPRRPLAAESRPPRDADADRPGEGNAPGPDEGNFQGPGEGRFRGPRGDGMQGPLGGGFRGPGDGFGGSGMNGFGAGSRFGGNSNSFGGNPGGGPSSFGTGGSFGSGGNNPSGNFGSGGGNPGGGGSFGGSTGIGRGR